MKSFAAMAFVVALTLSGPALALSPPEAEAMLRATITDFQNGSSNYGTMTPAIAEAVRTHPEVAQQLASLGPVTAIVAVGKTNPFTFVVNFAGGAAMNWTIAFDDAGKIKSLDATGK